MAIFNCYVSSPEGKKKCNNRQLWSPISLLFFFLFLVFLLVVFFLVAHTTTVSAPSLCHGRSGAGVFFWWPLGPF